MLSVLGIDWGEKKLGLALALGDFISPLPAVRNNRLLWSSLKKLIRQYQIEKIILGHPSGSPLLPKINSFAKDLESVLKLPIEWVDETGTTAQLPKSNKKRAKKNRDSLSAYLILQRWQPAKNC